MDINTLKARIMQSVDAAAPDLSALSRRIHRHPECGFKETRAAAWLGEYLACHGFTVATGLYELPTSFRAAYGTGQPVIAFLAEYDALPELGHACGHNIIGVSAAGAAVAAQAAADHYGGTLLVLGTPAEELFGGKITMIKQGAFEGVDAALMVHPGNCNAALTHALACQTLQVSFRGRAAHAASRPEAGINALEAMIQAFTSVNSLRQHIKDYCRIHGIITEGGKAANIVPDYSAATILVRAEDTAYLKELQEKVLRCFQGAARATGARLEYRWDEKSYAPMRQNTALGRLFQANLTSLGREVALVEPAVSLGSTDMGNVSQVTPALHGMISITDGNIPLHTPAFARAAVSERGMSALRDAAKALALTAADLLADRDTLNLVKEEFRSAK